MNAEHFILQDGRTLAYNEYGDPDGIPVFHAHGGPGSRLEGQTFHEIAQERGYRVIATDRPGMGESTYLKDRRLLDYPQDILQLANHLGIDQFGVTGWSGGGAHTTVCAYAIPERLLFNMSFAGYTNFIEMPGAEHYLKSSMDRMSVGLSKEHPRLFKLFFDLMGLSEKHMPESYFKSLLKTMGNADTEIASAPDFKEFFLAEEHEAFIQGSLGVTTDAAVHYVDWGFHLSEISFPIYIFHGTDDQLVPIEYAHHLSEHVPDCTLHILEGAGHLFPFREQELIFDTIDTICERGI